MIAGLGFEQFAANVAEYLRHSVGHAALTYPVRANGQVLPFLPAPVSRAAMTVVRAAVVERRDQGGRGRTASGARPPEGDSPWPRRIAERGSLEIQAYERGVFPGLRGRMGRSRGARRPFVGTLTLEFADGGR